jgi:hypothetical protein
MERFQDWQRPQGARVSPVLKERKKFKEKQNSVSLLSTL